MILTRELGSELTDNCHKNLDSTDSLHDLIDGYINEYNISNRCENLRKEAIGTKLRRGHAT